jgi:hypothetical protein
MQQVNIIQGEDFEIELAIRDVSGEPLPVKNIDEENPVTLDIKANLLSGYDIQQTFSINPEGDQGEIAFHDTDNHKVILKVVRAQSKNYIPGRLRIEVLMKFNDEDYPEGKTVVKRFVMGRITQSFTKEL